MDCQSTSRDRKSFDKTSEGAGHFALEEEGDRIGSLMHEFFNRTINKK